MAKAFLAIAALCLSGCAGVTVKELDQSGKVRPGVAEGFRYYMPRPYLLVVKAPTTTTVTAAPPMNNTKPGAVQTGQGNGNADPAKNGGHGNQAPAPAVPGPFDANSPYNQLVGAAGGGGTSPDKSTDKTGSMAATPSAPSDTGFQLSTPDYVAKLVYLPDISHTMAITESTGLFGTVSTQLTLQDGWMLTGVQNSADSKTAETISALASLASAFTGGGGAKSSGGGKVGTLGGASKDYTSAPSLRPGFYEFRYDESGVLRGLCALTLFTPRGNIQTAENSCVSPFITKSEFVLNRRD